MTDEAPHDDPSSPSPQQETKSPTPEPGRDSTVEDWMGQSVERDRQLAEELTREFGEEEAERRFDDLATGRAEQDARHGSSIDPEQGESAYRDGK